MLAVVAIKAAVAIIWDAVVAAAYSYPAVILFSVIRFFDGCGLKVVSTIGSAELTLAVEAAF